MTTAEGATDNSSAAIAPGSEQAKLATEELGEPISMTVEAAAPPESLSALEGTAMTEEPEEPEEPTATPAAAENAPAFEPFMFREVAPGMLCGGPVESAAPYTGIGMIILCAAELQPELPAFKGTTVRVGIADTLRPSRRDLENAAAGVLLAYDELCRGGTVLFSCSDGLGRAALVAGLTLGKRLVAPAVVTLLRRALGERVLSNATFHKIVWETALPSEPATAPAPSPAAQSTAAAATPGRPRGAGRELKTGGGRGYYGKAQLERRPKPGKQARS